MEDECVDGLESSDEGCMTQPTLCNALQIEERRGENAFSISQTMCVGLARIGSDDAVIKTGTMQQLKQVDFGPPMHSLVSQLLRTLCRFRWGELVELLSQYHRQSFVQCPCLVIHRIYNWTYIQANSPSWLFFFFSRSYAETCTRWRQMSLSCFPFRNM